MALPSPTAMQLAAMLALARIGLVQLPLIGPLVTFSAVSRTVAAGGVFERPGGHLVVSRGVGLERGDAPRLRFLCAPEVVVVDVLPAPSR